MPVSPRALVDLILLGPAGDRRQLQDSPILGDVWLRFATHPTKRLDLLITPYRDCPAGPVAEKLTDALRARKTETGEKVKPSKDPALVAYLQGLIAARLTFPELLRFVIPRTVWWRDRKIGVAVHDSKARVRLRKNLRRLIAWAKSIKRGRDDWREAFAMAFSALSPLDRYTALAGVILWASRGAGDAKGTTDLDALTELRSPDAIVKSLLTLLREVVDHPLPDEEGGQIWQISLNRKAVPALEKSVPAVKGDAVHTIFKLRCSEIAWAILDSGIDCRQPAFFEKTSGKPRVKAVFDFSKIRKIVSLDNKHIDAPEMKDRLRDLRRGREETLSEEDAKKALKALAHDAANDRPIHWKLVEQFIASKPEDAPAPNNAHGTHVAGILGGRGDNAPNGAEADGMCPDINLYDFRVLGKTVEDTEFAIVAALQFIRYMNERNGYISVHGANLSLSIPHDVRNFACGRTPICNECEKLVESGVVVVAAAGNLGYHSFETKDGGFDSYAAFSITDPGNADGVITVGSTHRFWPHTYGVSFFSSRGPTGDGRLKPDIVAPGERIRSCMLGEEWGELDGTSMAAPHVSGAAAMLMARYSELIGHPRKIKRILCESATDLGRERSFQGHGMLDVLRAFQKI